MTSQEFYELIDRELAPECKQLGFSRKRGTVSLWFVSLRRGTFFYEIFKGPKSPYIPYLGGRFSVHCDITVSADPKTRGSQSGISYMEYFSVADLDMMRKIRDQVLEKIVAPKPTSELDRLTLEMHAPLLRMEIRNRFRPHQVFKLPYLDAEDVSTWGRFLASGLEQTLLGARERPVFFMRIETDQPDTSPNGGPAPPAGNSAASEGRHR
jgi:hypothetical protein